VSTGAWITCGICHFGVTSDGKECRRCDGGQLWQYPSGHLALWPGGPFAGSEPPLAAKREETPA
jgi:hypothetical protein